MDAYNVYIVGAMSSYFAMNYPFTQSVESFNCRLYWRQTWPNRLSLFQELLMLLIHVDHCKSTGIQSGELTQLSLYGFPSPRLISQNTDAIYIKLTLDTQV